MAGQPPVWTLRGVKIGWGTAFRFCSDSRQQNTEEEKKKIGPKGRPMQKEEGRKNRAHRPNASREQAKRNKSE